ncbi:major histocompatibility complex class I-related gene protein isoform X4 [Lates calcarifer]|uniref:Major histocompatibility complex class I-related gene protein isoform X4 n=1 Tax=Lates calcarifer TaxID=8187 RepID=A0AAJ8B3X6_LATCA|nr:major histocompatibility complex class I-related gene protein isoform X4 [Lates calcarifer]
MELVFLLVFFPVTHSVKHSLTFFITESSGLQTFPEFVVFSEMDGVHLSYCDSNKKKPDLRQVWVKKLVEDDPESFIWFTQGCAVYQRRLKFESDSLKQHVNQTGGQHIFQWMLGCEWDEETGEVDGYRNSSCDGEDFITFDLKTETWIILTPQALITKTEWDRNQMYNRLLKDYLTITCPDWLKKVVNYGRSSLQKTDRPSVSLLQKTPSSPVSCHATGFYPDRAMMFWRKDGEELDEDVDRGEILPNHDGTFQMRADLNISSVSPEDWRRYDCVFQLSGVKEDIITKLDQAEIRTNRVPPSEFPAAAVIGVVVGLLLLLLCISGLFIWRRNNNGFRPANTSDSSPPDAFLSQ